MRYVVCGVGDPRPTLWPRVPYMIATPRPNDCRSAEPPGFAARPLRVTAHGQSDTGQMREDNEDHFVVAELAKTLRISQTSLPGPGVVRSDLRGHLLLVADG